MANDEASWGRMRTSIDAVLDRARAEWRVPADDVEAVILVATLDDASVRIKAPPDAAQARAGDLIEAGWRVEFRDLSDRPIDWSPRDGLAPRAADGHVDGTPLPLVPEADLRSPPPPSIDRLRDTA
jgi:hypothetical protein